MRSVQFYTRANGQVPVQEFLDSLPAKTARKVTWTLELVERLERVPSEYLKKLSDTDDIWEVRVQTSGLAIRLLGFFDTGKFVILTNGFSKKSEKTPVQEITLAEERKNDYFRRKELHP